MRRSVGMAVAIATVACSSCTYSSLSARGSSVTEVVSAPASECENLGTVYGRGGGLFGDFVSNDHLLEYAMNDARNKAADLGATHLQFTSPQMGVMGSSAGTTTTTATVVGVAFRCQGFQVSRRP
jgi:hypothetical protein